MPYKVLFVGLACFHKDPSDANDIMALLPDGRDEARAPHHASIVVRTADVIDEETAWPYHRRGNATIFEIDEPMVLTLPSDDAQVTTSQHRVPSLSDVDSSFKIIRNEAETIVKLQIHGTLRSYYMPKAHVDAIYTEVETPFSNDIEITSSLRLRIRLQAGSEIAIVNVSPRMRRAKDELEEDEKEHFKIYRKLTKWPVDLSKGPKRPSRVTKSKSTHPVFGRIDFRKVSLMCSNTGCC